MWSANLLFEAVDPDDITLAPSTEWLNAMTGFKSFLGMALGVTLIACTIVFLVGVVTYATARFLQSEKVTAFMDKYLVAPMVAAVLIGSMSGFVSWSTGQNLGLGVFQIKGVEFISMVDDAQDCTDASAMFKTECQSASKN